jgi:peptide chain release factor 2
MSREEILNKIRSIIQIDLVKKRVSELEAKMSQASFWKEAEDTSLFEELASQKRILEEFEAIEKETDPLNFVRLLKEFFFRWVLKDKYDQNATILSIYVGVGGKDAEDWVGILARMYQKFFDRLAWRYYVIDEQPSETGGYKFISLEIPEPYSYGILKSEHGIHRLVRISPFSAQKLRHTSFAFVDVLPIIEKPEFKIDEKDIEIQTFRASGRGGQNVNKVETAVRVIYKPLNLVVVCQKERYQHSNKEKALQILYSKIQKILDEEHTKELEKIRGKKIEISWGNQKRSYVFDPYKLVKDVTTKKETQKLDLVLNGHLELIHPYGEILEVIYQLQK